MQFQKISILPPQKGLEFPGLNWNFQMDGEVLEKIPSIGEVWLFLELHIFHYNLIARIQIQGKNKIYFYNMYVKGEKRELLGDP